MDFETEKALADDIDYKMICEQCGSLTIALPVEAKPSPNAVLSCGRCGAPRGTLQSLRDRSNRLGLSGPGL
jgi:transcription elongation factor Elf1